MTGLTPNTINRIKRVKRVNTHLCIISCLVANTRNGVLHYLRYLRNYVNVAIKAKRGPEGAHIWPIRGYLPTDRQICGVSDPPELGYFKH